MSNDLITIPSGNLPAHLAGLPSLVSVNDELTSHAGAGFAVMSIKGKVFTLKRGTEETLLMNPNDTDSPASSIEVTILKANPRNSKTYYSAGYADGADGMPDCMSSDGIKPDASSPNPQHSNCAGCPHNVWGSKTSEDGRKGKSCQDNVRIAIAAAGQLNDPMLLRVPPATIRPLVDYGDALKKRGIPYYAVVTKLGFDHTQATPKLTFKAVSYLDATQFAEAQAVRDSDTVAQITGIDNVSVSELAAPPAHVAADPAPAAPAAPAKPKASTAPKLVKPAAPAPVAPAPVVQATAPEVAAGVADALADVDALLSSLSGTDD